MESLNLILSPPDSCGYSLIVTALQLQEFSILSAENAGTVSSVRRGDSFR